MSSSNDPRTWRAYLRDDDMVRLAELPYLTLTMVDRWNDVGTWHLGLDPDDERTYDLMYGERVNIEITADHEPMMSGPLTGRSFAEDEEGVVTAAAWGVSAMAWVARRVVDPTAVGLAYHEETGQVTQVIRDFLIFQMADAMGRRPAGITLPAPPFEFGPTVEWRARYRNLLQVCQGCAEGGVETFADRVGFRFLDYALDFYQPQDRSETVHFGRELGNLASYEFSEEAPEATVAYVGGQGVGAARNIEIVQSEDLGRWGRVEVFQDRRDTNSDAQLRAAGKTTLREMGPKFGFALAPIDRDGTRYGVDYGLGDLVTVVGPFRYPLVDMVTQVTLTIENEKVQVEPMIGDPDAGPDRRVARVFSHLRGLRNRMNQLEGQE